MEISKSKSSLIKTILQNINPIHIPKKVRKLYIQVIPYRNKSEIGRHYKLPYSRLSSALNYTNASILLCLRPGHCRMRLHLFKIGVVDSPDCDFCICSDAVFHFLLDCNKYNSQRQSLTRALQSILFPVLCIFPINRT